MRKTLQTIIAIIAALVLLATGSCQTSGSQPSGESEPPPPFKNAQSAAEQALETFRLIATPENYKALGFESQDEIKEAQLGQPLTVFRVPLDKLQSFSDDTNPEDLLVDVSRVIYPVTVKEQVRSLIAVEGPNQEWRATDFGSPNLIRALVQFREAESDFIVHIPAFSLYFIARQSDKGLLLTPIVDDVRFKFRTGETLTASEVFGTILPFSKDYNGLPDG